MRDQLRWVHLSDLHGRVPAALEQRRIFDRLGADLQARRRDGWVPDFVFVTGDLATSGKDPEYESVLQHFLTLSELIGLDRTRFVFCPGNHDVDWGVNPVLLRGCQTSLRDHRTVDQFLASPERIALLERQLAFRRFVSRFYAGDPRRQDVDPNDGLHSVRRYDVEGLAVSVTATNSSWLCSGGDSDRASLIVGLYHFEEVLQRWDPSASHVAFALIHHPFDWLVDFEADHIESLCCYRFDVVLRGHTHRPRTSRVVIAQDGALIVSAGAVHDAVLTHFDYTCGTLDIPASHYEIEPVSFSVERNAWSATHAVQPLAARRLVQDVERVYGAVLRALGKGRHPYHITAILADASHDVAFRFAGQVMFQTPNVLEDTAATEIDSARALLRLKRRLDFYGDDAVAELCRDHRDALCAYDEQLTRWGAATPEFAHSLDARERDARSLVVARIAEGTAGAVDRYACACIARGDVPELQRLARLQKVPLSFPPDFGAHLVANGAVEPLDLYGLWVSAGGRYAFTLDDVELLGQAALAAGRIPMARDVLLDARRHFDERDSMRLRLVARVVATETGDRDVLNAFGLT